MVKVGNSECEFLKLTPLSRISAIAGAVCAVTMRPRRPSGTNRIRSRGLAFCADAEPAANAIRLADSNTIVRRIRFSPTGSGSGDPPWLPFSFALRQDCYIVWNRPQEQAVGGRRPVLRQRLGPGAAWRKHRSPGAVLIGRRPAMSKFQQKAEAQTKQIIGQML